MRRQKNFKVQGSCIDKAHWYMKNPSRQIFLFIILFGTMFLTGLTGNIPGVTYPLIKTEFALSYGQQGLMISILSIIYVLFSLFGGILIGSSGVKKTLATGFCFFIIGLLGMFFMIKFLPVAGALFFISAGFGLFGVSLNALATQIFLSRAALLMNLLHFFYGIASIFSPRAAGLISVAFSWRHVYLFSLPFVLLFFIPVLLVRFPHAVPEEQGNGQEGTQKLSFFHAIKTPMVWFFGVVLGLMMTVEMCSVNWAGLYFQDVYNLDPKTSGASFISNLFILYTISRLLSGFVIEKAGYMRCLFIASLSTVFIFLLGFAFGAKGIYILPVIGFFTAIFWPTLMAVAMGYFKDSAPVMTSAIIVIGGILNSGTQYLIGLTNRFAGPAWGYRSAVFYAGLIVVGLFYLRQVSTIKQHK